MARSWSLWLLSVVFVLGCGDVVLPGNGVLVCGMDRDGGHCPTGMTCCRSRCYAPEFILACETDGALSDVPVADGDPMVDVPADARSDVAADVIGTDVIPDVVFDTGNDANTDATTPDDVLDVTPVVDVADVVDAGMPDAGGMQDVPVIPDIPVIPVDAPDVIIMVDVPVRPDVPMDVGVDTGPDVPVVPVDVPTDTGPDVVDVPVDRPVDVGCPTGQTMCGGVCVDTRTDGVNCGACGTTCPAMSTCTSSVCRCTVSGMTLCGNVCVNLQTNMSNCGRCGGVCSSAGNVCAAGVCTPLTGRFTLSAAQVIGWVSDNPNQNVLGLRMATSSRYLYNDRLEVSAFRYTDTSFRPSAHLARMGLRFLRRALPPGTRVTGMTLQLTAQSVEEAVGQVFVATSLIAPMPWFNSGWSLPYWGVQQAGATMPPASWSAEVAATTFLHSGTPGIGTIPLNATGISALSAAPGDSYVIGVVETHDYNAREASALPMDGSRYAGTGFNPALATVQLIVDYGP